MSHRLTSRGLPLSREKGPYVIVRPNGRRSTRCFGSAHRAAEFAMAAYHLESWVPLYDRGFTIQPLSWFRE